MVSWGWIPVSFYAGMVVTYVLVALFAANDRGPDGHA
jgi:hypothetical protein